MTAKKTDTKPAESKILACIGKRIGLNVIVKFGDEPQISKKLTKEAGEIAITEVMAYNKRPTDARKVKITKMLAPEAAKTKEAVDKTKAKVKGIKSQIKKEAKKTPKVKGEEKNLIEQFEDLLKEDATNVDKLQAILNKYKVKEEKKPEPIVSIPQHQSRREY